MSNQGVILLNKTEKVSYLEMRTYGIVPEAPSESLDSIVSAKAKALASELLKRFEHSLSLEMQGSDAADSRAQVERLAFELKTKMDSRIWDNQAALKKRRKVSK